MRVLCVVGTRPEAIKMAPVILGLKAEPWAEVRVLATAQHRGLLDQVLDEFNIVPDIDLDIMRPGQSLADLTSRLLAAVDGALESEAPDAVLAQGDTTSVMVTALACFYRGIRFGHVEAGLRTGNIENPFPEELNRIIAGRVAKWHFAPTASSADNLVREGIAAGSVFITGNTVIDALFAIAGEIHAPFSIRRPGGRLILITAHRRESFGEPMREICFAVRELARLYPDDHFLFPVHPNPNVQSLAEAILSESENVMLSAPLVYGRFVAAMKESHFILSDSGGIQEEAPALGKPVLVLRDETERPEAVEAGVVKLVGAHFERIVMEARKLLDDEVEYHRMARGISPYGDGKASQRIIEVLRLQHHRMLESHCQGSNANAD